uniref:Uncharacterized protein n=1 Tax=Arion vulgaris TaxID=1028688 RepID=A0A0B7AH18_9EUPU
MKLCHTKHQFHRSLTESGRTSPNMRNNVLSTVPRSTKYSQDLNSSPVFLIW